MSYPLYDEDNEDLSVCALGRNRTYDPQDRNLMLYPLSYERISLKFDKKQSKTTIQNTLLQLAKYEAFFLGCQPDAALVSPQE